MRRALLIAVALVTVSPGPASAVQLSGTLNTLAGTGVASSLNGPAGAATFSSPRGLALAGDGTVYVGDYGSHRVRKIAPDGTVTTVAGDGIAGMSPDGTLAVNARVTGPYGVALSPDDSTLYLSQWPSGVIRSIGLGPGGTINTIGDVGGTGNANHLTTALNGDLYVPLYVGNSVVRYAAGVGGIVTPGTPSAVVAGGASGFGGDGGSAVGAGLSGAYDVAVNPDGSFAVLQMSQHVMRMVATDGTISTTAGNGSTTCAGRTWLCGDGDLAAFAQLVYPSGVAADGSGGYFVSDYNLNRVRHIDAAKRITTVVGTGGTCTATALCGDNGPARSGVLNEPFGLAYNPATGVLLVADASSNRIRAFTPDPIDSGQPGPAGPSGPTGPAGPSGPNGANGAPGAQGANGTDGAPGSNGGRGADGADGRAGRDGVDGARGPAGRPGVARLASPLLVAFPDDRFTFRRRTAIRLRYFATGPATVTATLTHSGRRVRRIERSFRANARATLSFGRLARGSYRLTIVAVRGRARAVDRAMIVVR